MYLFRVELTLVDGGRQVEAASPSRLRTREPHYACFQSSSSKDRPQPFSRTGPNTTEAGGHRATRDHSYRPSQENRGRSSSRRRCRQHQERYGDLPEKRQVPKRRFSPHSAVQAAVLEAWVTLRTNGESAQCRYAVRILVRRCNRLCSREAAYTVDMSHNYGYPGRSLDSYRNTLSGHTTRRLTGGACLERKSFDHLCRAAGRF
jgi:hypothetical protein